MTTRHLLRVAGLVLWMTGMSCLAGPAPAMAEERLALGDNDRYAVLASVLSLTRLDYAPSGPAVKIFGIGGGDPAMNGAFVFVCMEYNETQWIWKTELNVRAIRKASALPGNRIRLEVDQDFMEHGTTIVSRRKAYQLRFSLADGVLQNRLIVESAR